ncbi:MAG: ABC transporter permease [Anaerolineae bacterium]|nr:ABC transporter permease [Anaerolineae bacterium]
MRKYLIKRIAQNVFTFFLFLTLLYLLLDAQPGDYADIFINDPRLTAEQRTILRQRMGLDRPVYERYARWMINFFRGDFGTSFSNYPRTVLDVLAERAPRTLLLFMTAAVFSFYLGFIVGKILSWRRGGFVEYATTLGGVALYTVFTPWFGLMMIYIFAYGLDLFPIGKFINVELWSGAPFATNYIIVRLLLTGIGGAALLVTWLGLTQRVDPDKRTLVRWLGVIGLLAIIAVYWVFFSGGGVPYALDILWHLGLPVLTLALISFAGTMLLTRNSMLETLREDYILTARAKGLSEKVVRDKHAARNALLPVVTSLVFSLAFALDGGVITETVFSWPGMGRTIVGAVQTSDIPTAVGGLVFTGALALTAHLVADVLYVYLDPRVRYS